MKYSKSFFLQLLVSILMALPACAGDIKPIPAIAQNRIVHVKIDASDQGAVISPLLFGHNLEHTRKAIWQGISAEMIANRKFAAVENRLPKHWTILNDNEKVITDEQITYAGKYSVRLENGGGIMQQNEWLAFLKGTNYVFRIWTKSETTQNLIIRIINAKKTRIIFEKKLVSKPGDWQLLSGEFAANATEHNGQIELVSQAGGSIRIGALSLMPANNFHGMRRDVVDLMKQLKPGSLRWPGGCYAEFYHWQDGLLPADQRPPVGPTGLSFLLPATDEYDSQEIGIDEFIALCREVGSEPAITMRLSDNNPEDAAAWVEYCNGTSGTRWGKIRSERGQTAPYQVKCWFVGNELYSFGRGGLKDAEFCARQTKLFAQAMKKADPTIQLVGCTHFGKGDWNKTMIGETGDLLGIFSAHDYLLDRYKGDLSGIAKAPTVSLRPLLENARASLRSDIPKEQNFSIAFDEWNTRWGLTGSVSMGLYTAGVLNLLCREATPLQIGRAYYFMPVNEGAIKVTPLKSELDPSGEVFALYAPHQGNRLLNIQTLDDDADLDLCASLTPDGKNIYVTAVNRNATSDRTLKLSVADFKGPARAALNLLVPLASDAEGKFVQQNKKLKIIDGKIVSLKIPSRGIARVCFGSPERIESKSANMKAKKISE
jgi:alpha-L-arabinofuranosidase